jgi:hypothetical protein
VNKETALGQEWPDAVFVYGDDGEISSISLKKSCQKKTKSGQLKDLTQRRRGASEEKSVTQRCRGSEQQRKDLTQFRKGGWA